ncbi:MULTISPECIES: thiamine pyrophosphate-binding protein [Aphanothece]|uniref:thiamine pyrophosphate-binding protein n=1 Tax=Aphanothece TaxID=1121 RepID=UPI0039856123
MRGHEAILRQFVANDLCYMFGNPGTVEQGFLDALSAVPELKYILTLQESIAVLCADGYARARFKPALVQIHSTPGLGNAIGNLYQAMRGQAPLVVIGGDAGIRYQAMDAQMAGDLVAMAEPVTKWSAMVSHPSSLLRMVRRAIKVAATPPCGPVYLCLPQDVLDAEVVEDIYPAHIPSIAQAADSRDVAEIVRTLQQAENPIILVGDGVAWSGAHEELLALAEASGSRVYQADGGEVNFPEDHPLFFGGTGHMFGENSLPITKAADWCLAVGCFLLPEVFPNLGDIFTPGCKVYHLDSNPNNIAKNHRVDLSIVGDPKGLLRQLNASLHELGDDRSSSQATVRQKANEVRKQQATNQTSTIYDLDPSIPDDAYDNKTTFMPSGFFFQQLASKLDATAILFDEALTNSPPITTHLPAQRPGQKLWTRGGSLGTGLPGAIGIKLAHPDKQVIGISGDGGSMYTIQCLWTAARHGIAAKFVICQNRSYRLLQANIKQYWQAQGIAEHDYPLCFDLSAPEISFEQLAESMGVKGERVWKPSQVEAAIDRMIHSTEPYLINLVLDGDVHPELIGVHCGQ